MGLRFCNHKAPLLIFPLRQAELRHYIPGAVMSTIMPPSELLRRAVSYVSDEQKENPEKKLSAILDDAAMRFNLSPLDAGALERLFASDSKKNS